MAKEAAVCSCVGVLQRLDEASRIGQQARCVDLMDVRRQRPVLEVALTIVERRDGVERVGVELDFDRLANDVDDRVVMSGRSSFDRQDVEGVRSEHMQCLGQGATLAVFEKDRQPEEYRPRGDLERRDHQVRRWLHGVEGNPAVRYPTAPTDRLVQDADGSELLLADADLVGDDGDEIAVVHLGLLRRPNGAVEEACYVGFSSRCTPPPPWRPRCPRR